MHKPSDNNHQTSALLQFVINFAIPIFILTRFSSESRLGPINSMLLALAFPVAFELYNVYKRKKISLISIIAIGGILVTGAISLLGLSENWLAVRRSVPYLAVALAILISMQIKRSLVAILLPIVIDMDMVNEESRKKRSLPLLNRVIAQTSYAVSAIFIAISISSYILTRLVITAATGSTEFNEEYARLRILSLPFTTLPLLIGFGGAITYLLLRIEKITGLESDKLVKKR